MSKYEKPLPMEVRTIFTRHGTLPDGSPEFTQEAIPGQEVCDFCSTAKIDKDYDPGFVFMGAVGNLTNVSDDKWGACSTCAELIDADDLDGLVERSFRCFMDNNIEEARTLTSMPGGEDALRHEIRVTQGNFMQALKERRSRGSE